MVHVRRVLVACYSIDVTCLCVVRCVMFVLLACLLSVVVGALWLVLFACGVLCLFYGLQCFCSVVCVLFVVCCLLCVFFVDRW